MNRAARRLRRFRRDAGLRIEPSFPRTLPDHPASFTYPVRRLAASSALLVIVALCFAPTAAAETDDWFEEDDIEAVPQVGAKELLFLTAPPPGNTLLSGNRILIDESSLDDGWVDLEQCYRRLDAVPAVEIVFRYHNMRDLRVVRSENIGHTEPLDQSVQLSDVGHDATLCVQAEVQILYPRPDGDLELRNGPFMRKFLDGYFPMQVTLEIHFPSERLDLVSIDPEPQPGFAVDTGAGLIEIDSWFVGTLNIAVRFTRVPAVPSPH